MTGALGVGVQFLLDEGNEPGFEPTLEVGPRWMELPHARVRSRGFVLLPGEGLVTPEFLVGPDQQIHLQAMRVIKEVSGDGLELRLYLKTAQGELRLGELHLGSEQDWSSSVRLELSLDAYAGQRAHVVLRCLPGENHDPVADWAALLVFAIADPEAMPLAIGHVQQRWRMDNERQHFTAAYRHDIYGATPAAGASVAITKLPACSPPSPVGVDSVAAVLAAIEPTPGESAFWFGERLLAAAIKRTPINFAERLRAIGARRTPKILSLCAGEARIEEQLLREAGVAAELTLLDINGEMLARAATRMPASTRVTLLEGPVEALAAPNEPYDVVCFVSALHHVAALENVMARVAAQLRPDGEFWLIGEQVGRNGSRLWPTAQRVADRMFQALPERLRFNHGTGRTDPGLPDLDCSASTFEGVRSEEIPLVLARHFTPVVEERRNCFLWRLTDAAYAGNYDLGRDDDVATVRRLVAEEYAFFASGGVGCALNGVYRLKLSATAADSCAPAIAG